MTKKLNKKIVLYKNASILYPSESLLKNESFDWSSSRNTVKPAIPVFLLPPVQYCSIQWGTVPTDAPKVEQGPRPSQCVLGFEEIPHIW